MKRKKKKARNAAILAAKTAPNSNMVTLDDPNDPATQEKKKMLDQPIYYGKDKEVIRNEGDILKHINFDSYLIESNERQQFSSYEEYKDFLTSKGVESYIKYQ